MTDARLAPSILTHPVVEALSSDAFRAYVNGLVYSVDKGLDGLLPARSLRLLHPDGVNADVRDELLTNGLWSREGDGFLVRNFLRYQTPAAQVEQARENARLRKAKHRQSELDKEEAALQGGVTRDGTRDDVRDRTRDGTRESQRTLPRTGTGTGQAQGQEELPPEPVEERDVWPDVADTASSGSARSGASSRACASLVGVAVSPVGDTTSTTFASSRPSPEPVVEGCTCSGWVGMPAEDHMPYCPLTLVSA